MIVNEIKVAQLPLSKLCTRTEFIRPSLQVRQELQQNFDWNKFGAIVVKPLDIRDAYFDIVDGVVRKQVLEALNFPASTKVPCVIIHRKAETVSCRLALNGYVLDNHLARSRKNFKLAEVFELKYRCNNPDTIRVVDLIHEYDINIQWASQTGKAHRIANNCRSAELFELFAQESGLDHVKRLLDFLFFFKAHACNFLQSKALQACFLRAANRFLLARADWVFHSAASVITVKGKPGKTTKVVGHIDLDAIYADAIKFEEHYSRTQAIEMALANYFNV